jgi:hypothetical protein
MTMRSHRPRRLTLVAATLLVGAPVLWGSAALAQSPDQVTYTGGCDSAPAGVAVSPEQLSVTVGAVLEFVNDLDRPAVLSLNGEEAVELPPGGSVGVTLNHGPVTTTMAITCPTGELAASAAIEVTGPADATDRDASDPGADEDTVPGEVPTPRLDDRGRPNDGGDAPPPPATPPADGDEEGEQTDTQMAPASGIAWTSGPEGPLAVIAAVCLVGACAAAVRALMVRRTLRTY